MCMIFYLFIFFFVLFLVTHAESQMKYAKDKMIKIAVQLNATKSDLRLTRNMIRTMELELVTYTILYIFSLSIKGLADASIARNHN